MALSRTLLAIAPCVLLTGCCSLARLWCGPDDSRWVSISYDTPAATVATVLEALRRDAPDVVYSCCSRSLQRATGIGSVEFQIAWEKLREEGIHLAGYAEVPAPESVTTDTATFLLEVEGRRLRIQLVRESYHEVVYQAADGTSLPARAPLPARSGLVQSRPIDDPDFDKSRLTIAPFEFEHEGRTGVPAETIQRAGLVRLWKLSAMPTLEADGS